MRASVSSDASAISAISSRSTFRTAARLDRGRGERNLDCTKSATRFGKVRFRGGRLHRGGTPWPSAIYGGSARARVGGARVPWYVVGKDATPGVDIVFIAPGPDHPALFASSAAVGRCFWVAGRHPFGHERGHGHEDRAREPRDDATGAVSLRLRAKTRYGAEAVACEVRLVPRGEGALARPDVARFAARASRPRGRWGHRGGVLRLARAGGNARAGDGLVRRRGVPRRRRGSVLGALVPRSRRRRRGAVDVRERDSLGRYDVLLACESCYYSTGCGCSPIPRYARHDGDEPSGAHHERLRLPSACT